MIPGSTAKLGRLFILLSLALLVAGCATQSPAGEFEPPGFIMGLFHGFVILFSLIGSFFTDVRIYAYPNAGVWYDVGYFIGTMAFLSGGGASVK